MSLIDDALKRAREQGRPSGEPPAPATDAPRAEGGPAASDPWAYAPLPERRGRAPFVIAGVVGVVALAGIVAVIALRRDRAPASSRRTAGGATPPAALSAGQAATPRDATPLPTVFVPPPSRGIGRAAPEAGTRAAGERAERDVGVPRAGASAPPVSIAPAPTPLPLGVSIAHPAAPAGSPPMRAAPISAEASASGSPRIAREPSRTMVASNAPAGARAPESAAPQQSGREASAQVEPAPAPRARTSGPATPLRTYVGSFILPSGKKIELGGIVSSATPVALLNGRVVGIGGTVEGLSVVSIDENRVELSGESVHVFLALR